MARRNAPVLPGKLVLKRSNQYSLFSYFTILSRIVWNYKNLYFVVRLYIKYEKNCIISVPDLTTSQLLLRQEEDQGLSDLLLQVILMSCLKATDCFVSGESKSKATYTATPVTCR